MADPVPTSEPIQALQGVLPQVAEPLDVLKTILEQAVARTVAPRGPSLLEEAERCWLEQALEHDPGATRAELAERLEISESSLYKKLRQNGLGKG